MKTCCTVESELCIVAEFYKTKYLLGNLVFLIFLIFFCFKKEEVLTERGFFLGGGENSVLTQ